VAGPVEMAARWPTFADELARQTPYRAIICLPLPLTSGLTGALDLYLDDPDQLRAVPIADASIVADQMTDALLAGLTITGSMTSWSGDHEPAWMHSPAARERVQAWVAMGMLMTRMSLSAQNALALLRAYAYAHGTVLDEVAQKLVNGSLPVEQITS
jgi:disulfide bond formation protein DsbB